MSSKLSIVIPTLNEADNIKDLLQRLEESLIPAFDFEIIFIDDHSDDATCEIIEAISESKSFPIAVYTKNGERGKSFSLIEGFRKAKNDIVCMIDADLQYPPEAIPKMFHKIQSGADIIIANRTDMNTGPVRSWLSKFGRNVYGKWLHGLDFDVQSGLKVFRKDILRHISITPRQWTFDLEFLVRAKQQGYQIESVEISFSERHAGASKINLISSGVEIVWEAVKIKFQKQSLEALTIITDVVSEEIEERQLA